MNTLQRTMTETIRQDSRVEAMKLEVKLKMARVALTPTHNDCQGMVLNSSIQLYPVEIDETETVVPMGQCKKCGQHFAYYNKLGEWQHVEVIK